MGTIDIVGNSDVGVDLPWPLLMRVLVLTTEVDAFPIIRHSNHETIETFGKVRGEKCVILEDQDRLDTFFHTLAENTTVRIEASPSTITGSPPRGGIRLPTVRCREPVYGIIEIPTLLSVLFESLPPICTSV